MGPSLVVVLAKGLNEAASRSKRGNQMWNARRALNNTQPKLTRSVESLQGKITYSISSAATYLPPENIVKAARTLTSTQSARSFGEYFASFAMVKTPG